MTELRKQKDLITEKSWDCLVILDACRYDFFEKNYKDFLEGRLQKVISAGSNTYEWFVNTWRRKENSEDIVYIAGNVRGREVYSEEGELDMNDSFHDVVDVWDFGWAEELRQVPPEHVGKGTRWARAKYPGKRLLSHFSQPHAPYISGGWSGERNLLDKLRRFIGSTTEKVLGEEIAHKLRRTVGGGHPIEGVAEKEGKETLHDLYEKDLRLALKEVAKVARRLPGKMIVTADHGELLGEEGLYGHDKNIPDSKKENPILLEVPWLEVEA